MGIVGLGIDRWSAKDNATAEFQMTGPPRGFASSRTGSAARGLSLAWRCLTDARERGGGGRRVSDGCGKAVPALIRRLS